MASRETVQRSLDNIVCTCGPIPPAPPVDIDGYGEGGAISLSPENDIHSLTIGQDGAVAVSKNLNNLVMAEITLLQTSRTYRQLARLATAQYQTGIIQCNFFYRDPDTGDQVIEPNAIFQTIPSIEAEAEATDRTISIALPHARDQMTFGASIL
jgi:hypothetical protein